MRPPLNRSRWPAGRSNWPGLWTQPQSIDAAALAEMQQVEHEMVLQCSGNSRSLVCRRGADQGHAVGPRRHGQRAVRRRAVGRAGRPPGAEDAARRPRYLTAEGKDEPPAGEQDFEHSIPLDEALKKSIPGVALNGEPLPAIHGGPVRLVTPGYYGTMHVKWLEPAALSTRESDHTSQVPHYRTPRVPITARRALCRHLCQQRAQLADEDQVRRAFAGARRKAAVRRKHGARSRVQRRRSEDRLRAGFERRGAHLAASRARNARQSLCLVSLASATSSCRQASNRSGPGPSTPWAARSPLDGAIDWNPQGYAWNGVEKIDVEVAAG